MTTDDQKEYRPRRLWRAGAAAALFVLFLVLDQASKIFVRNLVRHGFIAAEFIPGILEFRFAMNTGAAFSLGEGFGFIFILLAIAVVVFTVVYLYRAPLVSKLEVIGLGMVAGGAVGNAIDRTLFGFVTDFICTQFIDFPIFNIADIGITCGAVIAFIGFMISPANKVDATAELNRRDAEAKARRAAKREGRDR